VSSLFSGAIYALLPPLLELYDVVPGQAGTLEAIAYETALSRSFYMLVFNCFVAFMDTGCGIVRGLSRSLTSTCISLLGACAFRVVWICTAFRATPTLDVLYVSYPLSWGLTAAAQLACACLILKTLIKRQNNQKGALA
jgi:Na+-driven multidrug efflux pump